MAATKALELAQLANTINVNSSGEITNIGTLSSIATTGDATFGANVLINGAIEVNTDNNNALNIVDTTASYRPTINFSKDDGTETVLNQIRSENGELDFKRTSSYLLTMRMTSAGRVQFYDDTGTASNLTWRGDEDKLLFADGTKATFGDSSDLQIYHDGSQSIIDDAGTGELKIRSNILRTMKYTGETTALFTADGAVTLYYDNAAKLATTSTGIDVTGTITTDDLVVSGNLTVSGTMTSINSDNLEIEDLNITLANGAADSTAASGAGLTVDGASATLIYTHDASYPGWSVNKNFGIGTTTPEKPIHVQSTINQLAVFESTDGRASIELRDTVDSAFLITESNKFAIHPSSAIGNNGIVLNLSDGKVGIGTDSPTTYLDIKGPDNSQARLEGTDTNPTTLMMDYNSTGSTDRVRIQNDAGDLKFTTSNGQVRQTLLKTGNVGIGTETPNANLEVNYTYNTNFDGQDSIGWNTWDGAGLLIKNSSIDSSDNYTSMGFFTGGSSGNFSARIATIVGSSGSGYMSFLLRDNNHTSHVNEKVRIESDGHLLPGLDNTQNLGSSGKRWANVYTGDLHLSNEGSKNDIDGTSGNWTVQEGEDHLYIINNKSGKKYRFALEEIE